MKLATLRDGTRDGRLVVVDRDLSVCADARAAAPTLQHALDHWETARPKLEACARALAFGEVSAERFDPTKCLAPLPRAYAWLDGSAYLNHVELARKARGAELPERLREDPLMYQGGSDAFLAACDPIPAGEEGWGLDLEAELAVVTGDVRAGATEAEAGAAIRLVTLLNDVSLRGLIPEELAKGFGFVQSKPPTAFAPVVVTPDELGAAWDGKRVDLPLRVDLNGAPLARLKAGEGMAFGFPRLVAHAARTRPLAAGTVLGSGTVSNRGEDGGPGKPCAEGGRGYACLAEQRMVETLLHGEARADWLKPGDRVRIEVRDGSGRSVFGAIDQRVADRGEAA